jgi:hypothetical protein
VRELVLSREERFDRQALSMELAILETTMEKTL